MLRWLQRLIRLRWLRAFLIGLAGLALALLALWALVTVPARILGVDQVHELQQITDHAKRLDEVNGLRSTLAAVLAGLAVVAGAIVGALNFRETSRQNRAVQEQNRAVLELQRRGQVTERYTKAIEQLGQHGDDKLDVRIGAVYALEQIARDSAELHWPIMEVLTAYLREHGPASQQPALGQPVPEASAPDGVAPGSYTRWQRAAIRATAQADINGIEQMSRRGVVTDDERYRKVLELWLRAIEHTSLQELELEPSRMPADRQAIATVIGRRRRDYERDDQCLDLHDTDLSGVRWDEAHLEKANLVGARLDGAQLSRNPPTDGPAAMTRRVATAIGRTGGRYAPTECRRDARSGVNEGATGRRGGVEDEADFAGTRVVVREPSGRTEQSALIRSSAAPASAA